MQQVDRHQPPPLAAPRRDPAPSRAAYRMQRLFLGPVFRRLLRIGLPMYVLVGATAFILSDTERRDAIKLGALEVRRAIEERPEFMVNLMAIDGASNPVAAEIRQILPLHFPVTAFDLDPEQMRERVSEMDAVASVDVRVRNGVLQINVTERVPAFVWRSDGGTVLLDDSGHRIALIEARNLRADLPLIAGAGADLHVAQAFDVMAAAAPLTARIRGLVRMGERRWDLVLDRNQRILLPEQKPIAALERVIALNTAQDMLGRDLTVIDMRNGERPTIRIADSAIEALRRIRDIN